MVNKCLDVKAVRIFGKKRNDPKFNSDRIWDTKSSIQTLKTTGTVTRTTEDLTRFDDPNYSQFQLRTTRITLIDIHAYRCCVAFDGSQWSWLDIPWHCFVNSNGLETRRIGHCRDHQKLRLDRLNEFWNSLNDYKASLGKLDKLEDKTSRFTRDFQRLPVLNNIIVFEASLVFVLLNVWKIFTTIVHDSPILNVGQTFPSTNTQRAKHLIEQSFVRVNGASCHWLRTEFNLYYVTVCPCNSTVLGRVCLSVYSFIRLGEKNSAKKVSRWTRDFCFCTVQQSTDPLDFRSYVSLKRRETSTRQLAKKSTPGEIVSQFKPSVHRNIFQWTLHRDRCLDIRTIEERCDCPIT